VLRSYFLWRTRKADLWVVYAVVPADPENGFPRSEHHPLIYWPTDLDDSKSVAERLLEAAWIAQVEEEGDFGWDNARVVQAELLTKEQATQVIERLNLHLGN